MICNVCVRSCATVSTPKTAPTMIPKAQSLRICQSTAPLRLCAMTDRADVTTIVANEVARQICIRSSDPYPATLNR